MYFGRDRDVKIKQLIAPAVPLWAEFEEPDGAYELQGCKTRGWAEPVIALALIDDPSGCEDGYFEQEIEALIANHDDTIEPIGVASACDNFRGLSSLPPVRVTK